MGKNSDHYFELLFGAVKAGVVVAPIGWRLAPPEVAYIVGDSDAALLFVGPEVADQAAAILPAMPGVGIVATMSTCPFVPKRSESRVRPRGSHTA